MLLHSLNTYMTRIVKTFVFFVARTVDYSEYLSKTCPDRPLACHSLKFKIKEEISADIETQDLQSFNAKECSNSQANLNLMQVNSYYTPGTFIFRADPVVFASSMPFFSSLLSWQVLVFVLPFLAHLEKNCNLFHLLSLFSLPLLSASVSLSFLLHFFSLSLCIFNLFSCLFLLKARQTAAFTLTSLNLLTWLDCVGNHPTAPNVSSLITVV